MTVVAVGLGACRPADTSRRPSTATSAAPSIPPPTYRTDPDIALIGTRWAVHRIVLTGPSATPTFAVDPGAYLVFDGAGGFEGFTGCARIGGTAVIANELITVTVSKAPACTGSGLTAHNALLSVLHGNVHYRVDWLTLTLSGPDGAEVTLRTSG